MKRETSRLVFFAPGTVFLGWGRFCTKAENVRGQAGIVVSTGRGEDLGDRSAFAGFTLEQSSDCKNWKSASGARAMAPGEERVEVMDLDSDWVRMVAEVHGANPGVPAWAIGDLLPPVVADLPEPRP